MSGFPDIVQYGEQCPSSAVTFEPSYETTLQVSGVSVQVSGYSALIP
jgi:hypothetical protein